MSTPVVPALQIGKKLGNGHFGEVYLAHDSVHGQVAVKVLSKKNARSDAEWIRYKQGFLAEAQHLSKARHRNVVRVHHITECPATDTIRLCMDYCPGGALQKTYESGPMTLESVRKVATEVALGLQALHSRGMLHRDIKPGNILIDAQGVAQLGDFGLVTDDLILGYGSQAGYADHIAKEVWDGAGTSIKTDIWALGMTIFRLLHGMKWYELKPRPSTLVSAGGYANGLAWLPHVPSEWRRSVRKMLADDAASRYQNCDQVLTALSRLPVAPNWSLTVDSSLVKWERLSKSRHIFVEWKIISPRQHTWRAWSEGIATKRQRRLDGSEGTVTKGEALKQLKKFFAG